MKLLLTILLFSLTLAGCSSPLQPSAKYPATNVNVQLGMNYLHQHDYIMAKQKFLIGLSEDPYNPACWNAMGYFLEITGHSEEAENFYLKAIRIKPGSGMAHNNYGTYLCRAKHYMAGIKQFLLAAQDINYLYSAEAYENAGLCALKIPDRTLAKQFFIRSLQNDPKRRIGKDEMAMGGLEPPTPAL